MSKRSLLLLPFLALAACSSHRILSPTFVGQEDMAAMAVMEAPASQAELSIPVAREVLLPAAPAEASVSAPVAVEPESSPDFAEPHSVLSFMVGARFLDGDQYRPVEDQGVFGVEYAWLPVAGLVGIELGGSISTIQDDFSVLGVTFTASSEIGELYIGGRVEVDLGLLPMRVFAGAGGTLLLGSFGLEHGGRVVDSNDASTGLYAHAGAVLDLDGVLAGFDIRGVGGTEIDIYGRTGDLDYVQAALLFGVAF